MVTKAFLGLVGAVALAGAAPQTGTRADNPNNPPKVIFIMSDEHDLRMDWLSTQVMMKQYVINKGTAFSKHYSTGKTGTLTGGRPVIVSPQKPPTPLRYPYCRTA